MQKVKCAQNGRNVTINAKCKAVIGTLPDNGNISRNHL